MYEIELPRYVFEDGLLDFIQQLGSGNQSERICLDFNAVSYYIPAAIVTLVVKAHKWHEEGKEIFIRDHDKCSAYTYLQRIDFFNACGLDLKEGFERHDPLGRFVPIRQIGYDEGPLAAEIAACLVPDLAESDDIEKRGPFDCLCYTISELSSNANQHSKGRGFATAQYADKYHLVRVAIADTGIGIKESFRQTGSSLWKEEMSELDAVNMALEPEVSSTSHLSGWGESVNAGVGLTLLLGLAQRMNGKFILVSQNAYFSLKSQVMFDPKDSLGGTLCSFGFDRRKISNFHAILYECKKDAGLIKNMDRFKGMFK